MKTRKVLIAALLAAASVPPVEAQGLWREVWGYAKAGLPQVQFNAPTLGGRPIAYINPARIGIGKSLLAVVNATGIPADNRLERPIYIEVRSQEQYADTLAVGESWKLSYGAGWYGWYGGDWGWGGYCCWWAPSDNLVLTVSACTDVEMETRGKVPSDLRTTDPRFAGPDALTLEFFHELEADPSGSSMEKRAKKIEYYMNKNKVFARKEIGKALDEWVKEVRAHGLTFDRPRCLNPVQYGNPVTINRWTWGTETQVLFVRGTWPNLSFSENR